MKEDNSEPALELLLRAGGPKLLSGMIAAFSESAPERIARAESALARNDAPALAAAAHSLKSSAGQLGATALQRAVTEIEQLALQSRMNEARPLLTFAAAELEIALSWMQQFAADHEVK